MGRWDKYETMEQRWQFYDDEKTLACCRTLTVSLFGCIALGTSQVRPFQPIEKVNQSINQKTSATWFMQKYLANANL